jgi:chaperonin GroES
MDVSRLKPTGQWVLVKVDQADRVSKGGIIMPDGNILERLGHASGRVMNYGPGRLNPGKRAKTQHTPVDVKVGDTVVFRGHMQHANRPSILDREHCLIHETDIYGVLEEGHLEPALPYDN